MQRTASLLIAALATLGLTPPALAQSSSLLQPENAGVEENAPASSTQYSRDPSARPLNRAIGRWSLIATDLPEPRTFSKHDLITIIVRESQTSTKHSELETEKEANFDGEVSSFYDVHALLTDLVLKPASFDSGTPQVGVELSKDFEGEGEKRDSESFTTRLQAQIIDVKPNGNIVIEARTFIRNDTEVTMMTVTGICRAEDVTSANTVLSNQLFDLRIARETEGEIKKTQRKGIITKVLDVLLNF